MYCKKNVGRDGEREPYYLSAQIMLKVRLDVVSSPGAHTQGAGCHLRLPGRTTLAEQLQPVSEHPWPLGEAQKSFS